MGPRSFAGFCAVCCVILYACISLLTREILAPIRADLTHAGTGHLSAGSRAVVSALKEPLELTLYRTRLGLAQRPDIQARGERVWALLRAYEAASGGQIVLRERDPIRFSVMEDQALRAGLSPLPDRAQVGWMYLGLAVANTLEESVSIAQISAQDEPGLERAVTALILRLDKPDAIAPDVPARPIAAFGLIEESPKVQALRIDLDQAETALARAEHAASSQIEQRESVLRLRSALRVALKERSAMEARLWTLLVLGHIVLLPCACALASAWAGRRARRHLRRGA